MVHFCGRSTLAVAAHDVVRMPQKPAPEDLPVRIVSALIRRSSRRTVNAKAIRATTQAVPSADAGQSATCRRAARLQESLRHGRLTSFVTLSQPRSASCFVTMSCLPTACSRHSGEQYRSPDWTVALHKRHLFCIVPSQDFTALASIISCSQCVLSHLRPNAESGNRTPQKTACRVRSCRDKALAICRKRSRIQEAA